MHQPLRGIRLLDLSRVLAGPLASMTLGDFGANVIKVERPGAGDETRAWGPPFDDRGEAAYYLSVNRNKLGVALDLDNEEDRRVLYWLIAGADVVLDNYKRGTLERKGIDPDALLLEHQRLIWCTITGFGPESDRPGYDYVVQAESGWMSVTGPVEGEPTKSGIALADVVAGKDAAIAILCALVARSAAGGPPSARDRRLSVSLWHSAVASLVNVAQNVLVSGREARRWGNGHPNLVPYQLFRASDRHLVVAVGNDAQWRGACAALGLVELGADLQLATNQGRLAQRERVIREISSRVSERTAGEWILLLERAGVPCGVVKQVHEALGGAEASPLSGVAPRVPGIVRLPPPRLGEHDALVRAHGWDVFAHLAADLPLVPDA